MNEFIEETIKPAVEFLEKIKQKSKVVIVHGHDNDSVCSAVIMYKLLKNFHKIESRLIISDFNFAVSKNVIENIKRMRPDYVIVVDIAEIDVTTLTELRNISQVMVIDHHATRGYVKITYVNPRIFDDELYIPVAYLCYKIYGKFLDTNEILWIAGIGTLSDMGLKNCNDLFEEIKTKNNDLVDNNENIDDVLYEKSLLGQLAKIFDSARIVNGIDGSVSVLNAFLRSEDYHDILNKKTAESKKLFELYDLVLKEFEKLLKDFEKKKKRIKNIVVYEVKSKYNIKSPLASHLSKKTTNEVIVIYQKSGRYIDVSFRRGKVCIVDLNRLASNSVKNIPDSNGGGHVQAAGSRFPAKYLNKFLKNLKSK